MSGYLARMAEQGFMAKNVTYLPPAGEAGQLTAKPFHSCSVVLSPVLPIMF